MSYKNLAYYLPFLVCLALSACKEEERGTPVLETIKTVQLDPEEAAELADKIRAEVAAEVADGFELRLWASDSLVIDPVAVAMDNRGRAYFTRANRQKNSEFDIRGHMDWATESIGLESVEDRRKFLHKIFAPENSDKNSWMKDMNGDGIKDWQDLAVEKDEIYRVEDRSGDGVADFAQLFIADFHEEVTDVANGVLPYNDDVYVTIAPDLWRLQDKDNDGIADTKESISHGYGVHIGFSGHGMSGLTMGPDGRIYWGIGDIGMNVTDKTGKQWKYPNQGVIARSNPDGTDFEVFAAGLRNTHEFVFDKYGNIFSEDNDGDHRGESERLVYIVNGSDTGWRINWQFGKYTDPDNNDYKVWMEEELYKPRFPGQAAYITPPIMNYKNGPTGMKYNPGTALNEKWDDHFFLVEFPGAPSRATINAFQFAPKGAGFEFAGDQQILKGVLATGLDFGPDGAMYFGDWIEGWGTKDYGRIWKMDVTGLSANRKKLRAETQELLFADLRKEKNARLGELLQHADMRVRLKAQYELARRGTKGAKVFMASAAQKEHQIGRIHGLWGLWQLSRKNPKYASHLVQYLSDDDHEIIAQAAKIIGDIRFAGPAGQLVALLQHESPRVRFFAAEAIGRIGHNDEEAIEGVVEMLQNNNDEDVYLRHAGALALARIGEAAPVVALAKHPSRAVRIAAVVTLRRMSHPGIADFLADKDEYIVTEAARAINDDYSIEAALPALAGILNQRDFSSEALIRRIINANLRSGSEQDLERLVTYANNPDAPADLRAEAVACIGTWAKPSPLDRVDGRYRGTVQREPAMVRRVAGPVINILLADQDQTVQAAAATAAGKLALADSPPTLLRLVRGGGETAVRVASLRALDDLGAEELDSGLSNALKDRAKQVRVAALEILSEADLPSENKVALFASVLRSGSLPEQQTAITAIGKINDPNAAKLLDQQLQKLLQNRLDPGLELELENAIANGQADELKVKWAEYVRQKPAEDVLSQYSAALAGGDAGRGWRVFNTHEMAQCTRCHSLQGEGSDVGPSLGNVAKRLSREELLESIVAPSAKLSLGYGVETLTLTDGETVVGFLTGETTDALILKVGTGEQQEISKTEIKERDTAPSSMPPMGELVTKTELRDLVEFLSTMR